MRRRDVITLAAGATTWPFTQPLGAEAQRRVGVMSPVDTDPRMQSILARSGRGWRGPAGPKVAMCEIDYRWAGLDGEFGAAIRQGAESQQSTMSAYQPSVLVTPRERSLLLSQCVLGQFEPKEGRCL